jgi:hypothetical protein
LFPQLHCEVLFSCAPHHVLHLSSGVSIRTLYL